MSPNSEPGDSHPSDPFPPAERIRLAAAREAQRSSRVIWFYGILSLAAIVAAILFLRYGQTDRQLVQSEVQAQVAPVRAEVEQARPALQEVKQLGTLAAEVRNLGAVASEVQGTVAKVQEHGAEIQDLKSRTEAVATTMNEREAQLNTLRTEAQTLRTEISSLREEQVAARQRFDEIARNVKVDLSQFRAQLNTRDREIINRIERERLQPVRPHVVRPPG